MTPFVISMVVILAVAGLVVAFTAFPHRGEDMPGVPWLGEALDRASGIVPTLEVDGREETRTLATVRED